MGFTSGWSSRKELTSYLRTSTPRYKVLAHATNGNELWMVQEDTEKDERFIMLFLISKVGGSWGYKEMFECEGPYYFGCPASFFDLVPEPPNETAKKWRVVVTALAEKLAKIGKGVTLKGPGGLKLEVTGKRKRSWIGWDAATGKLYTLTKGWLENAEIVETPA